MVNARSDLSLRTRVGTTLSRVFSALLCTFLLMACGTTDQARLKESRNFYLVNDFEHSEASLYTPEVFKNSQNRLEHYYLLSSIAMNEGQFEKANYFLSRARETAISVRSATGGFEWFSSKYQSNPVEFSYLHSMMVLSYTLLAEAGETKAWSTPQIKDDHGNILVEAQTHPARHFNLKEIADFRQKARAELLAWDSFLETLKRTYPDQKYYREDLWARIFASYLHGGLTDHREKRTAELLAQDAKKILTQDFAQYPSAKKNSEQITKVLEKLSSQARTDSASGTFVVLEAGVMPKYKIRRFHLGLSTLFNRIEDPQLRSLMEQIGMHVLINSAPEFGLVLLGGGLAGAITPSGEDDEFDGPPRFFSNAVDQSFGFEIKFPTLQFPPADTKIKLSLLKAGSAVTEVPLPVVSPLQEILATEVQEREQKEMFARALKIGGQYLAILIPAIQAYRQADRGGNLLQKLAILAGYFIAKKAIDRANMPDLRSWNYLPKLIGANFIEVPAGEYDAKLSFDNSFGHFEQNVGKLEVGNPAHSLQRVRVGNLEILNHPGVAAAQ